MVERMKRGEGVTGALDPGVLLPRGEAPSEAIANGAGRLPGDLAWSLLLSPFRGASVFTCRSAAKCPLTANDSSFGTCIWLL